jgi:hypothetical protein
VSSCQKEGSCTKLNVLDDWSDIVKGCETQVKDEREHSLRECEGSRSGSRVEEVRFENKTAIRKNGAGKPIPEATECFVEQRGRARATEDPLPIGRLPTAWLMKAIPIHGQEVRFGNQSHLRIGMLNEI